LSKLRIGSNGDVLFDHSRVEFDLRGSLSGGLLVVTEKRTSDAQQVALHVELVRAVSVVRSVGWHFFLHSAAGKL
jgi:hypothetical protein